MTISIEGFSFLKKFKVTLTPITFLLGDSFTGKSTFLTLLRNLKGIQPVVNSDFLGEDIKGDKLILEFKDNSLRLRIVYSKINETRLYISEVHFDKLRIKYSYSDGFILESLSYKDIFINIKEINYKIISESFIPSLKLDLSYRDLHNLIYTEGERFFLNYDEKKQQIFYNIKSIFTCVFKLTGSLDNELCDIIKKITEKFISLDRLPLDFIPRDFKKQYIIPKYGYPFGKWSELFEYLSNYPYLKDKINQILNKYFGLELKLTTRNILVIYKIHKDKSVYLDQASNSIKILIPIVINLCILASIKKNEQLEKIILLENPESYLHNRSISSLLKFIIEIILPNKISCVIETQSERIVNELGIHIAQKHIKSSKSSIIFFGSQERFDESIRKSNYINQIFYDNTGFIPEWPLGFFSE